MPASDERRLHELTEALAASLRADAQTQREAGDRGLAPALVAAWAAGTLSVRAKSAVERLAAGNPLAMEQLATAIAALPEPVPVPAVGDLWLARAGRAADEVAARVRAYAEARGEAALDRLLRDWQAVRQAPVPALAGGAAFAGSATAPYLHDFAEVTGLHPSLVAQQGELSLHLRGATLEHADQTVHLLLVGPSAACSAAVYLAEQPGGRVWGHSPLGPITELVARLGTQVPEPIFLVPS